MLKPGERIFVDTRGIDNDFQYTGFAFYCRATTYIENFPPNTHWIIVPGQIVETVPFEAIKKPE